MKRRAALALSLATLLPLAALVAEAAPSAPGAKTAPAAPIWTLDKAASRLTFRGTAAGQPFDGVFKRWDAEIAFDPANLKASHVTITVDVASAVTGDPGRDLALPGPDWFAAVRFPRASFVTTSIAPAGAGRYVAAGALHIKAVTKVVSAPAVISLQRDHADVTGALTIRRSAFGLGGRALAGAPAGDEVVVSLRLSARRSR